MEGCFLDRLTGIPELNNSLITSVQERIPLLAVCCLLLCLSQTSLGAAQSQVVRCYEYFKWCVLDRNDSETYTQFRIEVCRLTLESCLTCRHANTAGQDEARASIRGRDCRLGKGRAKSQTEGLEAVLLVTIVDCGL